MDNRDSDEDMEEDRTADPSAEGPPALPPRAEVEPARPRVWPPVLALLLLATIIWMLLERFSPPGAFGG